MGLFDRIKKKMDLHVYVVWHRMLSTVLDRFGHSVMASPVDKSHFRITVPVAVSDQFYGWIFGLGNYVTIVGPDSVKEGMKHAICVISPITQSNPL